MIPIFVIKVISKRLTTYVEHVDCGATLIEDSVLVFLDKSVRRLRAFSHRLWSIIYDSTIDSILYHLCFSVRVDYKSAITDN